MSPDEQLSAGEMTPVLECDWRQKCRGKRKHTISHYSDVIMSAMASQSPVSPLFAEPFVQVQTKEYNKALCHLPLFHGRTTQHCILVAWLNAVSNDICMWHQHLSFAARFANMPYCRQPRNAITKFDQIRYLYPKTLCIDACNFSSRWKSVSISIFMFEKKYPITFT